VKDQDVDEARGKSEGVYSKCGVPHVKKSAWYACQISNSAGFTVTLDTSQDMLTTSLPGNLLHW